MLTPRLLEVKEKIERKENLLRSEKENALLKELNVLDEFLEKRSATLDSVGLESLSESSLITSGPRGGCSCCGK